jgi:hypothetical protein
MMKKGSRLDVGMGWFNGRKAKGSGGFSRFNENTRQKARLYFIGSCISVGWMT